METWILISIICVLVNQKAEANVIVSVTIHAYSNPNGTAYVESSSDRKCCDGPQRADCENNDTCDTYFDICVGRMEPGWGCKGASFHTSPLNNTNNMMNLPEMESQSNFWKAGMSIFVIIRDDDSKGVIKAYDHIDTLIDELKFNPSPSKALSPSLDYKWEGKTTLSISVKAWCAENYFGPLCDIYCQGIQPMARCESSTGHLTCQYSDELLLEFNLPTNQSDFAQLDVGINRFMDEQVCHGNSSRVYYPQLDTNSNTLSFTAYCGNQELTALQFESMLMLKTDDTLKNYFSFGVATGHAISPKGYGEHIVPNVYVGVEILDAENPTGTSYDGNSTTGERRCCDVPSSSNCNVVPDKCDMQFSICIGEIVNGMCVGAVTISNVFKNTTSLSTCGPTLLEYTTGQAFVSHPLVGAMRLTKSANSVQVMVKDSDLNGKSFDVIDVLSSNITIQPGTNIRNTSTVDITMNNTVKLTLRLLFWCAPGHSGPLCHADNGTDHCFTGWYGDECDKQSNPCSPSPCENDGSCTALSNSTFSCKCTPGYNGTTCTEDIDECALPVPVCQNGGYCENLNGSFSCDCTEEWTGRICTDQLIDVCDPSPCYHGNCLADLDSTTMFMCMCDKGWVGWECNLKSMCFYKTCIHGDCTPMHNEEICFCHHGFTGDNCTQDIDECQAKPCKNAGVCTNSIGNFSCGCLPGYTGNECQNTSITCQHVVCQNNGTCLDYSTVGNNTNYTCLCNKGFTGQNCEQTIDVCEHVTCENGGNCTEIFHDFQCNCSKGWSGKTCDVDVNECSKSVCKHSTECSNIDGSYSCSCISGWTGTNCDVDIDECSEHACLHGNCSNSAGSYHCACADGYNGPNCTMQSHYCNHVTCNGHGTCVELSNGYTCKCFQGYDGQNCETDKNECKANICGDHSTGCNNVPGSYNCSCSVGWQGVTCSKDVNECVSTKVIPCSGNGHCINTVGSFKCSCLYGFTGAFCDTFINGCNDLICYHNSSCKTTADGPKCACAQGFEGIRCSTDIDECESFPCQNNGNCANTEGSFYCSCPAGWTGSICDTDVNECMSPVCQNNGVCTNSQGAYTCACQNNFYGLTCEVERFQKSNNTATLLEFYFNTTILSTTKQRTLSDISHFLSVYVCNGSDTQMSLDGVVQTIVRFAATCSGSPITQASVEHGFTKVPEGMKQYLFPQTFTGVKEYNRQPKTASPSATKSWISTVIVVSVTAAVVIATVGVGVVCYKKRRQSVPDYSNFDNPSYVQSYDN